MSVQDRVKEIIDNQEQKGLKKYGKKVDQAELGIVDWINHAQEEAADILVYLQKLKEELHIKIVKSENEVLEEMLNRIKITALNEIKYSNNDFDYGYHYGIRQSMQIIKDFLDE